MKLREIAHSRTGDKGNRSNISVIAWHEALWPLLVERAERNSGETVRSISASTSSLRFKWRRSISMSLAV